MQKTNILKLKKIVAALVFFILLYFIVLYKIFNYYNSPLDYFLHIYTLLTSTFLLSRFIISFFYQDTHSKTYANSEYPSVSFVIACKNEEDSIYKTIDTCLNSNYPGKMECIAVNDGSTDNTLCEMQRSKDKWSSKLRIIDFEKNRGKREGMAEGVLAAKGEIIVFVDSDSFVERNALKILVEHFLSDPKVGAVSGNSLVENASFNALTKMQSARYGISYDVFKSSESVFGAVTCCPGCFSGYRKVAIMQVLERWRYQQFLGSRSTFGDDRSLTNFVLRKWKVVYCREAKATTIVPTAYKKFFKQQLRWKKSWIREGFNAGAVLWRKHPVASISYYLNLILPIFGPVIVFKVLFLDTIIKLTLPYTFLMGVVFMSILFGVYHYLITPSKYWFYVAYFTVIYTFVLIWQMPYALFKIRDTSWGTR